MSTWLCACGGQRATLGVGSVLPPRGSWALFEVVILGRTWLLLLINFLDFARENFM